MTRVRAIAKIDHHDRVMAQSRAMHEAHMAGCFDIEIASTERIEGAWRVQMSALCESSTKPFVTIDGIPTLEL